MYLLLAVIVLLLLFAASYGGPGTWIVLASSTLSVLLVAGCAFIANAGSAGPYFKALAAHTPTLLRAGVQDLAFAAERTAAARTEGIGADPKAAESMATETLAVEIEPVAPVASTPEASDENTADWLELSWLTPSEWISGAVDWLDPTRWFAGEEPSATEVDVRVGNDATTDAAAQPEPRAQVPQAAPAAPMPTVRAMMHPRDGATQDSADAPPAYRIVTPPTDDDEAVTGSLPDNPNTPVTWLEGAAVPAGLDRILLSGTNVSNAPLEDIEATLKPDTGMRSVGTGNLRLSIRIEGPDGTAAPGAFIPPGARFHLQAADLSEDAAQGLGGAIVSFAYSQSGRRRTSIMYLNETVLGGGAGPQ